MTKKTEGPAKSYKIIIEVATGKSSVGMTGDQFMKVSIEGRDDLEPGSREYNSSVSTDLFLAAGIFLAGGTEGLEEFMRIATDTFKRGTILAGVKRLMERELFVIPPELIRGMMESVEEGEEKNFPKIDPEDAREMAKLLRQRIPK